MAVISELIMVPSEIQDKKLRQVFDAISDSHAMGSFLTMPDGSVHMTSKSHKANVARYIIMKDRLVLSYEICENSMSYYQSLMSDFLSAFSGITGVSLFPVQGITIRKLVNVAGIADSRDYLIKKVFSIDESRLAPFKRPLHMFGTRILFPPTAADQSTFEVKIETALEDYKTFYLENKAMFPAPLDAAKGADLGPVIKKTDDFLNENIMGFILGFAEGK